MIHSSHSSHFPVIATKWMKSGLLVIVSRSDFIRCADSDILVKRGFQTGGTFTWFQMYQYFGVFTPQELGTI